MGISVFTAPVEDPLTLAEVKLAAHITTTVDDVYVDSVIAAATKQYEHETRRQISVATYDYFLTCFPSDVIEIPFPPLASVTSVKYLDGTGTEQTLAASVYDVDTATEPGAIFLKDSQEWPTIQRIARKVVTVRFVAGLAQASVAAEDKRAILFLAVHWLENREPVVVEERVQAASVPLTWDAIVNTRKIVEVG